MIHILTQKQLELWFHLATVAPTPALFEEYREQCICPWRVHCPPGCCEPPMGR